MLFISNSISDATDARDTADKRGQRPVLTNAGPLSSINGAFGNLDLGVPLRSKPSVRLARFWQCPSGVDADFAILVLRRLSDGEPQGAVNGVACMAYADQELKAALASLESQDGLEFSKLLVGLLETVSWQVFPPNVQELYDVVTTGAAQVALLRRADRAVLADHDLFPHFVAMARTS